MTELLPDLREELRRRDTEHAVFHGCWDWHSAVHGHWALLRAADLIGAEEDVAWVGRRLLGPGMAQEFATLRDHPDFEWPYGRAWLLRLLMTFEQISGCRDLRAPSLEVARSLEQGLASQHLHPDVGEYTNPSWALLQLHAWARWVEETTTVAWVREVVSRAFLGTDLRLATDREPPGEFFSRWALQAALVGEVLGGEALAGWLGEQVFTAEELAPVQELHSSHHLGLNASRAWGFWAAAQATGSSRWAAATRSHVEASLALHERWRDDRRAYTHWVPQFTIYAVALDAD